MAFACYRDTVSALQQDPVEGAPAGGVPADVDDQATEAELRARLKVVTKERNRLRAQLAQDEPLRPFQIELLKLQHHLEMERIPMMVLFEGRDASGKGGTIRRMTRFMNEKRYRVVALGKPTDIQKSQWYFQRYVPHFPAGGEIVLFDRSWYNRALVEPVLGFCTKREHRDFLKGVVGFEKDLVRQGTVLVKLYFSVDKEVQQARFERRKTDPLRQWKLSEVDMQAQEYWDDFTTMKHRMLERTSTDQSPWTIVRSNSKPKARLNAMKVILNAINYADRDKSLDFKPDPKIVISGADELARMDEERDRLGRAPG
ncbi:MAG: polyphosphate kinase 2 [Acidimicrobiia bacterium]|nr:polyphosphate kinase 2 [Acidimicrobiia bacterium]MBT8246611.1 polyphosphate kinase 2 [Acidimicrobiia bacterium]